MTYKASNLSAMLALDHGFGVMNDINLPSPLICPEQQHGGNVRVLQGNTVGEAILGDAVFTYGKTSVGVVTADCVPILVASTQVPIVGAIHAGWKGIVAGVVENSISALLDEGVDIHSLRLAIGPCIGRCCYEIDRSTLELIETAHGSCWNGAAPPWYLLQPEQFHGCIRSAAIPRNGHIWLDLASYIQRILRTLGVQDDQLEITQVCTYCGSEELDSYRRRQHFALPKAFQYSWISNT